jgi:hypothetical protein
MLFRLLDELRFQFMFLVRVKVQIEKPRRGPRDRPRHDFRQRQREGGPLPTLVRVTLAGFRDVQLRGKTRRD